MHYRGIYASLIAFFIFISEVAKCTDSPSQMLDHGNVSCFECNVWKAGFGNECQMPRIVDGCFTCMKLETTIFIAYYKDTPRYSTQISRVCGKPRSIRYHNGCMYFKSVDGFSKRCYCETNLCNSSPARFYFDFMSFIISTAIFLLRKL